MSTGKHPQLAKKLSRLYSLCINPSINNNAALAKHLGISRQAISKWVHGSDTTVGNCIPHRQIREVAATFSIEPYWFSLELGDFGEKLELKLEPEPEQGTTVVEKISLSSLPITGLQLYGRDSEIDALERAWHEQSINCLEIVAFGGIGKSSLVNSWLSRLDKVNYSGARRVYCWSFCGQGSGSEAISSGDLFIEQALEWFGDKHPEQGTPWAKANRLANLIREARTLLILDGLEPLQYPPGPRQGEIETPALSLLLRELAANNNGMCLVTSRMAIAELADFNDGRIKSLHLDRLNNADGVQLLTEMGVRGDEHDMQEAVEAYSGHPLCLSLLAGYLLVVHDGAVSNFRGLDSLTTIQTFNSHAGSIVRAYLRWFESSSEISLLNLLGLFDRAIAIDDVKALVESEVINGLTEDLIRLSESQWSYAVKKLEDANLISKFKRGGLTMIDCHPLVRDFLNQRLKLENAEVWRQGNRMIFTFLQSTAIENPSTMMQLEPLFRAVVHGTRAGLFEESFQLYFERIKRKQFSIFTEGSHHADQSCIRAFFRRPWSEPVEQLSESASFYLLSCAAANLIYLGKIDAAIAPSIQSIRWFQRNARWIEAAVTSGPLISMLIAAGRLRDARAQWNRVQESVQHAGNVVLDSTSASIGAYLSFLEGKHDSAKRLFEEAESILNRSNPECEIVCPTISAYYCKYLLEIGETTEALERALLTLHWREENSWQVTIDTTSLLVSDLQILGLIYLQLNDLQNASRYLNRQVDLLKTANEWLYLPSGLIARAKLYMATDEFKLAQQDLSDASAIARTTGAQFSEGEASIDLAELALMTGELQSGQMYIRKAKDIEGMEDYSPLAARLHSLESRLFPNRQPELNSRA
ncbi:MAG: hypothetical protein WDZ52_09535 [Pseudohongiellaceae bacterium]